MRKQQTISIFSKVHYYLTVFFGSLVLTLAFFFVLPLMQTISKPPAIDLFLTDVDLGNVEPPPPSPQVEEQQEESEPEDNPPELIEADAAPLDLEQLEIALNPGLSSGWMGNGDFAVSLNKIFSDSNDSEENINTIFSLADLDQKPQIISQPGPILNQQLMRKTPGSVEIIFIVDENGHVTEPRVRNSSDAAFEKPAMAAVKRWVFEPGKKSGKAVRFRMLVPISFPKG
ncbi:MAG: energy transducer TonB [Sedimentisphaerales bacterium]|nr:energy transducer TonB [Sedimentisphaerales bacterium]